MVQVNGGIRVSVRSRRPKTPGDYPLVKDENLIVPPRSQGEFFQILSDQDVLGASRQIVDGAVEKRFDFPAVVNKAWGLHKRYPGFYGREYNYEELPDDWCQVYYEMLEWASSYKLPKGEIVDYEIHNDGGKYAIVEPNPGSMTWVWTDIIVDGKSHTDAVNVEHGARDPITGRNPNADENFHWLTSPCILALCKRIEDRGSVWGFETLDITQTAKPLEYILERPWLYYWANAASRTMVDGRYVVSDYPQIDKALKALDPASPRTGTPMLNIGKGGIMWIDKKACTPILEPGTRWSAYVPAK